MKNSKVVKRILLFIVALVILFSTAKSLDLLEDNNILEQMKKEQNVEETNSLNAPEEETENLSSNIVDNDILEAISCENEGLPILSQVDQIKNDYYGYVINSISVSKELGDFHNPYDILGNVDKEGNTVGAYSYIIINLTIECYKEFPELYLNTLRIYLYKGADLLRGYEALTSNNTVSMTPSKSDMRCIMKKGEEKDFNIVYLVDDEYIEDADFYLYINNLGASYGHDTENKRLVKLDTKEAFN
ncbi:MAG: hypothetical protein GX237_05280 [Clostridiales bacterium]|nr:hypothetical protein [Clostridiales bacterium]